ncbi:hypothetical protein [Campylobacter hyointestinalis]|uniref:hypothetical protein n=1 Tax=Campylobacter hyointestinalis TaxID=198 RepID=UPI000CE3F8C8|nr:hypothetical protein [Campylobacter hyointestinalis]PPB54639.1 hypothetical protein CDQ67_07565 [Campylobacter hyointestinalis subsp. hyointestinalis]
MIHIKTTFKYIVDNIAKKYALYAFYEDKHFTDTLGYFDDDTSFNVKDKFDGKENEKIEFLYKLLNKPIYYKLIPSYDDQKDYAYNNNLTDESLITGSYFDLGLSYSISYRVAKAIKGGVSYSVDSFASKKEISLSPFNMFNIEVSLTHYDDLNDSDKYTRTFTDELNTTLRLKYKKIYLKQVQNEVIDSTVPFYTERNTLQDIYIEFKKYRKKFFSISRLFARECGVVPIPIEHLVMHLGYTLKDIKDLMLQVKQKKYNFIFAGFGGTGVNTAYWLTEFSQATGVTNLFKNVYIYDSDTIELSNVFRFPDISIDDWCKNYYYHRNPNKIALYTHNMSIALQSSKSIKVYALNLDKSYLKNIYYGSNSSLVNPLILYGSPDLVSRRDFISIRGLLPNFNIIYATHKDNSCLVEVNPTKELDTNLANESYGMVELNIFFMNQIRMAIKLLEVLASGDFSSSEFNYSFADNKDRNAIPKSYKYIF